MHLKNHWRITQPPAMIIFYYNARARVYNILYIIIVHGIPTICNTKAMYLRTNGRGVYNIISGFLMRPTHLTYTRALLITP